MFKCEICGEDCRITGTNVIGVEIQEYLNDNTGWVSMEEVFTGQCKAREAMKLIPEDGIKRRIFPVLERRQYSRFEETV